MTNQLLLALKSPWNIFGFWMLVHESDHQRIHLLITIACWSPSLTNGILPTVQNYPVLCKSLCKSLCNAVCKHLLKALCNVVCNHLLKALCKALCIVLQSSVQRFPAPAYSGNHRNQVQKCFLYEIDVRSLRAKISWKHNTTTSFYDLS